MLLVRDQLRAEAQAGLSDTRVVGPIAVRATVLIGDTPVALGAEEQVDSGANRGCATWEAAFGYSGVDPGEVIVGQTDGNLLTHTEEHTDLEYLSNPIPSHASLAPVGAEPGATLVPSLPTTRPRHTITEVGDVEDALRRVRAETGAADLRELVVLGAEAKLKLEFERRGSAQRGAALRERLIARTASPGGVDSSAAAEVRRRGWARAGD